MAAERIAFERFIDFLTDRLRQHPGMHVYHYAPYEPTAKMGLAELERRDRGIVAPQAEREHEGDRADDARGDEPQHGRQHAALEQLAQARARATTSGERVLDALAVSNERPCRRACSRHEALDDRRLADPCIAGDEDKPPPLAEPFKLLRGEMRSATGSLEVIAGVESVGGV